MPLYFDTETCGFVGPIVLLQWAEDDSKVRLENLWKMRVRDVIKLFEYIASKEIVGFNLSFDYFALFKQWTVLNLLDNPNAILEDCIREYYEKEAAGRDYPFCLKPYKACDLFLWARKTEYQSCMERKDIRIRRVPNQLAYFLVKELDKRIILKDIFFARKKDKEIRWQVFERKQDPSFKDVVLKFAPSSALKALAIDALGHDIDSTLIFSDIDPNSISGRINEVAYAPFASALAVGNNYNGTWPDRIKQNIDYWSTSQLGKQYATDDVIYTRELFHWFKELLPDKELINDTDSILACMVGCVRWKGFKIDREKITKLRDNLKAKISSNTFDPDHVPTAPIQVMKYLMEKMSPEEQIVFKNEKGSTKRAVLEELSKADLWKGTEVAERAKKVLESRKAKYLIDLYNKLLKAGRLHPDFKVIGTLSGRMSGGSLRGKDRSINPQGIPHSKEVRSCFPLAFEEQGFILCIGDQASFEVALAECAYNDPNLRKVLTTCDKCDYQFQEPEFGSMTCPNCQAFDSKTKLHALFAMELFPGKTYKEIIASKGTKEDLYDIGKRAVFALIYGGNAYTLHEKLGIALEIGEVAYANFVKRFKMVEINRQKVFRMFCSMSQPGGIGTQVIWRDPADYIESLLGFRRYFTLENQICKALFDLANKPPKGWAELKIPVVRRDRIQMVGGAVQSALYAASFNIQSQSMRAAANHIIQSTGAEITKKIQRKIWDLQPPGKHEFLVIPMNIHDEIAVSVKPEYAEQVARIVQEEEAAYRKKIPLLAIDWKINVGSWADK